LSLEKEKHGRLCSISSILLVGSGLSTKAFGALPKYARLTWEFDSEIKMLFSSMHSSRI
jgi:hypothetical protein